MQCGMQCEVQCGMQAGMHASIRKLSNLSDVERTPAKGEFDPTSSPLRGEIEGVTFCKFLLRGQCR
ncbi:hypothetical protein DIS09_07980 [Burkholderia pseudomallei]|nr:hypothetical protein EGY14_01760 [Burkholderia pseudomallei]EBA47759.1 hypothetical protein BURPS305_3714 [Burkholderia pseudomallei 305]EEP50073.1 conserved hypothetical protein [Burkholderia pseudomallei MSHR346]PNX05766.1 hypothetical protein CF641_18595 [Burkholderia pseudomallei]PNX39580.1 hypothetical protein CF642_19520 [Burkholderia pseudomallei]